MALGYTDDEDGVVDPSAPLAPPMAAPASQDDDLRTKLYASLQQRLSGGMDPAMAANRKDVGDETRRNAFLTALNQSANQAGSIGGKVASSGAVKGVADSIASASQDDLGAQAQGVANKQKVQEYLLGKIQQDDQFKSTQQMRKDAQAATFAQNQKLADEANTNKKDIANIVASTKQNINDSNNDAGRYGGGARADAKVDDRFTKFGHDLNSGLASSRSDMGKQQATVSAADKVLTLGKQGDSQKGGLDNRQIHEIAISSAALVGGGTGAAQSTIEALVPHSAGSVESRIEEWLTGNPTGADQQQFVHRMLETAEREKQLAGEKIKGYKAEVLDSYSDLAGKDPDRYNRVKARVFGDNSQFDKNGAYVQQPYQLPAPAATVATPSPGTAMAAPAGPKAGDIEDGHVFLGGDPANPNSWKAQ